MHADPKAFGQQLRESVTEQATEAAKRAVGEHITELAATIAKAGQQAAEQAARAAVQELGSEISIDLRDQVRAIAKIDAQIAEIGLQIAKIRDTGDFEKAEAALRDVAEQTSRLIDSRRQLTDEQRASRLAEIELRAIAKELAGGKDYFLDLSGQLLTKIGIIQAETDQRVARVAALAVEGLRQDMVKSVAHEGKTAVEAATEQVSRLTEQVRADLLKIDDERAQSVERTLSGVQKTLTEWQGTASEAVETFTKQADRLATELVQKADGLLTGTDAANAPLTPRAYRGAYRDKAKHQRGDLVTYLGSTFIAERANETRPSVEPDGPWRLFAAGGFGGSLAVGRSPAKAGTMASELVGEVKMWPAWAPPPGFLRCDGEAIPEQYPALAALVGEKTPDLTARFVRAGKDRKAQDQVKLTYIIRAA